MLDLSFAVKQCVCCEGCSYNLLVESHYKSESLINKQQFWMASQALVTELHGDLSTCYIFLSCFTNCSTSKLTLSVEPYLMCVCVYACVRACVCACVCVCIHILKHLQSNSTICIPVQANFFLSICCFC